MVPAVVQMTNSTMSLNKIPKAFDLGDKIIFSVNPTAFLSSDAPIRNGGVLAGNTVVNVVYYKRDGRLSLYIPRSNQNDGWAVDEVEWDTEWATFNSHEGIDLIIDAARKKDPKKPLIDILKELSRTSAWFTSDTPIKCWDLPEPEVKYTLFEGETHYMLSKLVSVEKSDKPAKATKGKKSK